VSGWVSEEGCVGVYVERGRERLPVGAI